MLGPDTPGRQTTPPQAAEPFGHVLSVSGSQVRIGLLARSPSSLQGGRLTVGRFVKIKTDKSLLVGAITDVSTQPSAPANQGAQGTANVDLMGEISARGGGPACFRRGVMDYPTIGDAAAPFTDDEMRVIFGSGGSKSIKIGHLQQDSEISVCIDVDEMLSKHFAVLGTTGVGKSSAVALLLHQILRARPDLR